jgi:hypothetical protein
MWPLGASSRRRAELTSEPDQTKDPAEGLEGAEPSTWSTWATVLFVGEASLVLLVILLGSVVKVNNPLAYLAALGVATFAGGRVGGIRGAGRWLLAGILILLVAIAVGYLLIWVVVSQMKGP